MAKEAKPEQWTALSNGPPWTYVVGSRANAERAAKEMRKDGFSGVRVEKYETAGAEQPKN
jgi:hypothetical protein